MKNAAILALLSCAMALTTAAYSQTWVSNTGSDSNPCTMASPCKTFAHAVSVTPAWGQLSVLNAGDYGPVTITQSIRIEGNGLASISVTSGNAILVNLPAGDVVQLHNLSLHGSNSATYGIDFGGAGGLDIDNVQISGFNEGIGAFAWSGASELNLVIKDTTIENISSVGIYIQGASTTTLASAEIVNTHVRFANTGIEAIDASISVLNSTITSPVAGSAPVSSGDGIYADNTNVYLDNSQINGYGYGLAAYGAGHVQVNRSSFINNSYAVISGTAIVSNGSNTSFNNTYNTSNPPVTPADMW
jgi:hypothetical protein